MFIHLHEQNNFKTIEMQVIVMLSDMQFILFSHNFAFYYNI